MLCKEEYEQGFQATFTPSAKASIVNDMTLCLVAFPMTWHPWWQVMLTSHYPFAILRIQV